MTGNKAKQLSRIVAVLLASTADRVRATLWNTSGRTATMHSLVEYSLKGPCLVECRIRRANGTEITPYAQKSVEALLDEALTLPSFRIDLEEINHGKFHAPCVVATHPGEQWPHRVRESVEASLPLRGHGESFAQAG